MEHRILRIQWLVLITLFLLCTFVSIEVSARKECRSMRKLKDEDILVLTFHNLTKSKRRGRVCTVQVTTRPMRRLLLHLDYKPHARSSRDCLHDYVHVGNEETKVNDETVTSYKYCSHTLEEEVVSRENYMWIVIGSKLPPDFLRLRITVQRPAECPDNEFECSPLQCVSRDQVCDGKTDCQNGRDEFCGTGSHIRASEEECFRCMDGTCISPWLPRYSADFGKSLWYLCDGINHCPDSSDERRDLCARLSRDPEALVRCVPAASWDNRTEVTWAKAVACDGVSHCLDSQDERLAKCDRLQGRGRLTAAHILISDPAAVILLVVAVTALVGGGIFNYIFHSRRSQKDFCRSGQGSDHQQPPQPTGTAPLQPVPEGAEESSPTPEEAHLPLTDTSV